MTPGVPDDACRCVSSMFAAWSKGLRFGLVEHVVDILYELLLAIIMSCGPFIEHAEYPVNVMPGCDLSIGLLSGQSCTV
jgi:hypothetical protein